MTRSITRRTFGKLHRTKAAAQRAMNLTLTAGWTDPRIETVTLAGETFYKVTGDPVLRRIYAMHGTIANTNAPRGENPKFRHASRYRHRGKS